MTKYRCKVCGYIYDPECNGGTEFENLSEEYRCPVCGAAKSDFEAVHQKGEEYTGGEAQEKHVPVIEVNGETVTVKVGSVEHPMIEGHYINMIELYDGPDLLKKEKLQPNQEPKAVFEGISNINNLKAFAYCNLHGVWESE